MHDKYPCRHGIPFLIAILYNIIETNTHSNVVKNLFLGQQIQSRFDVLNFEKCFNLLNQNKLQ